MHRHQKGLGEKINQKQQRSSGSDPSAEWQGHLPLGQVAYPT